MTLRQRIYTFLKRTKQTRNSDSKELRELIDLLEPRSAGTIKYAGLLDATCAHCKEGIITEGKVSDADYLLEDSIWSLLEFAKKDMAHIDCANARAISVIGRPLWLGDFQDVPVNAMVRWALNTDGRLL